MEVRRTVAAEARRRGLKLSTTVRVLVTERLQEIEEANELTRTEHWQRAQAWTTLESIRAGDRREASQAEIDDVFEHALAHPRRTRRRTR
jgi:hypothetical protein